MICKHCKKEFDNNLPACPHCGFPSGNGKKTVKEKSNSQESLWIKIVAIAAVFFLIVSTFAVVLTIKKNDLKKPEVVTEEIDDKAKKEEAKKPEKEPVTKEDKTENTDEEPSDSTVEYGMYPQSLLDSKKDEQIKLQLSAKESEETGWITFDAPNDFMQYKDVDLGAEGKYRAVKLISPRPNATPITKYCYVNTVYWFRFEPIEWVQVKGAQNGEAEDTVYYLSEKILDFRASAVATDFYSENSNLNNWLNSTFLNNAFAGEEDQPVPEMNKGVSLISGEDVSDLSNAELTDYAECLSTLTEKSPWLLLDKDGKFVTSDGNDYIPNTIAGIRPFVKAKKQ
ncbi:MAG: hypothetical protein E7536_04270 [Ruminococcaceae bacterium]|nr:hypothetical protein [Oscillospiraceae bacterium]